MIKKLRLTSLLWILSATWFGIRMMYCYFNQEIVVFEAHEIAVNMIKDGTMEIFLEGQHNYNYQFPVYPFLVFVAYKLGGINPFGGIVINALLHLFTVLISYRLFISLLNYSSIPYLKKHDTVIAFLSSLFILLHPAINYYTYNTVHPFALDLFLLITTCYFLVAFINDHSKVNYLLFSLAYAVSCLNRFSFIVLIIPLLIYFVRNNKLLQNSGKVLFTLFCCFLFLFPWVLRNYNYYQAISINSSFGQNLWIGIQAETEGTAYLPSGRNYRTLLPKADFEKTLKLDPAEQSNYFTNKYVHELKQNPAHVLNMYFKKLNNFWFFSKNMGIEQGQHTKQFIPIYKIGYLCMLALALVFVHYNRNTAVLLFSLIVSISLFQAMFYVETRHRIIIEPLLFFMAVNAIYAMRARRTV